jgi:hypothetical protein
MRGLVLVSLFLACGGVSDAEVAACQAATKALVAELGCKLHWVSCMETDGAPKCDFEAECGDGLKRSSNTCLKLER